MSRNKHYECDNCGAVYRIKHDLDENHYVPSHCAFCGEGLDEESNFDLDEDLDD